MRGILHRAVNRTFTRTASLTAYLLIASCAPSAADQTGQPFQLTYASLYPPTHPFSSADLKWMKFMEDQSGGRIRIKPFWSASLISSDQNLVELRHGLADVGMVTPMYARSAHLQRVQSSFYGPVNTINDQIRLYHCVSARFPALNAELPGLHILAVQGGNNPGILTTKKPVGTLADLRGLRIRAQHDMFAIIKANGGDPVDMPMSEVYSALARGVIDGVITPIDALGSLHLAEVGGFFTALEVPRGAYPARAISGRKWRALPENVRRLLTRSSKVWERAMAEDIEQAKAKGTAAAKKAGIRFVAFDPADSRRFQRMYAEEALKTARSLASSEIDAESIIKTSWAMRKNLSLRPAGQCPAT
jgi:TRAP-type C4-dicarboxylate transport system substrate-binding protein